MTNLHDLMHTNAELCHRVQALESTHRLALQAMGAMARACRRLQIPVSQLHTLCSHLGSLRLILLGEVVS